MEESWQTLFRFAMVFMKVGFRDRAKIEAEVEGGEGSDHEKKKKQRSTKGRKQEVKRSSEAEATAVHDGENRIPCKECGKLRQ